MQQPRIQARSWQQSRGGKLQRPLRPLTKGKARLRREREEDGRSVSRGPTPEFSLLDVHPAFRVDPRLQAWLGDSMPPESLHPRPSSASERRKRHVAVCDELQQQPRVLQVEENVWQDASLSYVLDAKKRTAQLRQKTLERLTKDIQAAEEAEHSSSAADDDSRATSRANPTMEAEEAIGLLPSLPAATASDEDLKNADASGFVRLVSDSTEGDEEAAEGAFRDSKESSALKKSISFSKDLRTDSKVSGSFRKRLSLGRKASKELSAQMKEAGVTASSIEQPADGSSSHTINIVPSTVPLGGDEFPELVPGRRKGRPSVLLQEVRANMAQKMAAAQNDAVLEEDLKPTAKKRTSLSSVAESSPSPASMGRPNTAEAPPATSQRERKSSVTTPQPRKSVRPSATHRLSAAIVSLDPFQNRRRSSGRSSMVGDAALSSQRLVLEQRRKLHGLTTEADIKITRDILQGTSLIRVVFSQSEKENPGEVLERELAPYELEKLPVFKKEPDRDASYVWLLSQLVIFRGPSFKQHSPKLLIKGVDKELLRGREMSEDSKNEEAKENFTELANIFQNFQGKLRRDSDSAQFHSHEPEDESAKEEKARDNQVKALAQTADIALDTADALMTWFRALNTSGNGKLNEDEFRVCVKAIYDNTKRTLTGGDAYLKRLWKYATTQAKAKDLKFEHWSNWLVEAFPHVSDMYPSEIRQLKAISTAA